MLVPAGLFLKHQPRYTQNNSRQARLDYQAIRNPQSGLLGNRYSDAVVVDLHGDTYEVRRHTALKTGQLPAAEEHHISAECPRLFLRKIPLYNRKEADLTSAKYSR
jgi:hypothetical protein